MVEIKRFRALDESVRKQNRIVDKVYVYDNGKKVDCCVVHKDDEGREYYFPSNPNDKDGLFTDKPKDAIECIRKGFGDCLIRSYFLGSSNEDVIRYLDRDYGEGIRKDTIEGFKDAKFAYGVKFVFLDSFSGSRFVCKNNKLEGFKDKRSDILTFETQEDAEKFIKGIEETAEKYLKEYLVLEETKNVCTDYNKAFEPFFNKIRSGNGIDSVYWRVFTSLCEERDTGKSKYKMRVVQVLL